MNPPPVIPIGPGVTVTQPNPPLPTKPAPYAEFKTNLTSPDGPMEPGKYIFKVFASSSQGATFLEWASKTMNVWDKIFRPEYTKMWERENPQFRLILPPTGTYFRIRYQNKIQTMPRKWFDPKTKSLEFIAEVKKR